MKNKKAILPIAIIGIAIAGTTLWSTGVVKAQFGNNNETMAQELASKLDIDESKVSEAMEQIRTDHQEKRQAQISTNLDKAVTDGVITAEQKQKILDKHSQMKQERGQKRQEMQQWEEENGIDMSKIREHGIGNGQGKLHRGQK